MKFLRSLLVILVASFGILSSCHREEGLNPQHRQQKVSYADGMTSRDGILLFKDWSQFYGHVNSTNTVPKLADLESKYNYKSLLGEYMRSINDSSYVETSDLIYKSDDGIQLDVANQSISSLLNKDGIVIIGASVYRFKGDKIFGLPVGGANFSKALSTLASANPKSIDSNVEVSTYKQTPVNVKKTNSANGNASGTGSWDRGGYRSFYMGPKVEWGVHTNGETSCDYGLVYDEDSRGYVCAGPVTDHGVYTHAVFSVVNTITMRHCFFGCSTGFADDVWIRSNEVQGYFDYRLEGVTSRMPFNGSSTNYSLFVQPLYESRQGYSIDFDVFGGSARFDCILKDGDGNGIGSFWSIVNF